MKSYISLIWISAKKHKHQNIMTRLCIMFSVFMVTAVFSMAEMGARMEQNRLTEKHGSFTVQYLLSTDMGQSLFLIAIVLFILILIAGVLMISSSIHSSVAQRTKFFGMMRCIGMSKKQMICFVRLEALSWCKTSVPIGIILGVVASWIFCFILRFLVGEEFINIPLFKISLIGILSGAVMGILTVFIAASAPAKQAAKVPPVVASSGNAENIQQVHHILYTRFLKIPIALGISHAISAKKNLILITSSFALSIILFLSFSVLVDFVGYLMPQPASTSDIDISSTDGSNSIDYDFVEEISSMQGVEHVYGRRTAFEIPAEVLGESTYNKSVDIVSFDDYDLECLQKDDMLQKGTDISKIYKNTGYVLATWDNNCTWKIGDIIKIGNEKLEIAGLLNKDLFSENGLTNGKLTLITSDETFKKLTGVSDYSLVMIQTAKNATEKNIEEIKNAVGDSYIFMDKREQSTFGTYIAFLFCIYCFLGMVALVTMFHIINSISMSVSSRTKQYGFMRAVGMDGSQITKMIAAEAFTYAFLGCIVGCIIGLPISKILCKILILDHFQYAFWDFPIVQVIIIILFVISSSAIAVYSPSKKLRKITITDIINEI